MLFSTRFFWISMLIFGAYFTLEQMGLNHPLADSYLNDLLCPPLVLGLALFLQQQFTYRKPEYVFNKGMILFFVVWYSILFEGLLPFTSNQYHADILDVVAYSLGALAFYAWGNKPVGSLIFKKGKVEAYRSSGNQSM